MNDASNEDMISEVHDALALGLENLATRQTERGSWSGDYGGPQFLLPMYVFLHRIAGRAIPGHRRDRMVEYLLNTQNPDGSLGLHAQGDGCMFTTVLGYSALHMLGPSGAEERLHNMRTWILENGTALGAAPWGKFMLALLNMYPYEGLNPVLPELWLLPESVPIHPSRFWCHARQVYLPMAWLYGLKAKIPADDLTTRIRNDIYDRPYDEIPFRRHRDTVAASDNYTPPHAMLRAANRTMLAYERVHSRALRERAMAVLVRHMDYEDRATSYANLGPVNAVLNRVCLCFRPGGREILEAHWDQLDRYLWDGHDGMKMNGYLSTEMWDTVFSVQAIMACGKCGLPATGDHRITIEKANDFIRENQITEDLPDGGMFYRHPSKGGWPFCSREHGWPITDCTSEGLRAAMALEDLASRPIPRDRMRDAVLLILSFQNEDGGWSSYEKRRGGLWLERLNPSLVFGDIMVDISYPECTSACVQGLVEARSLFADELGARIDAAVEKGVRFLRSSQRPDGSWEGSWGVCFTYGTWFGVSGLVAAGVPMDDPAVLQATSFLLSRQKPDGGWGEHHSSCSKRRYVDHEQGQAVMTSWALSTLVRAGCRDDVAMSRAARFLTSRKSRKGGWPRETMAGVFNRTCLINYDNYRHYFPVLALAEWLAVQKRT